MAGEEARGNDGVLIDERLKHAYIRISHIFHSIIISFLPKKAFMAGEEARGNDGALIDERRPAFEAGISKFYPAFRKHFKYHDFFVSMKTKVRDASANRQVGESDCFCHVHFCLFYVTMTSSCL
jgi:hypothetical protein